MLLQEMAIFGNTDIYHRFLFGGLQLEKILEHFDLIIRMVIIL